LSEGLEKTLPERLVIFMSLQNFCPDFLMEFHEKYFDRDVLVFTLSIVRIRLPTKSGCNLGEAPWS
jgi:hypothetical protein